jgi:hypothetical protein
MNALPIINLLFFENKFNFVYLFLFFFQLHLDVMEVQMLVIDNIFMY